MDSQKCKKKIQSCSETEDAQISNLVTLLSKCSGKVTESLSIFANKLFLTTPGTVGTNNLVLIET